RGGAWRRRRIWLGHCPDWRSRAAARATLLRSVMAYSQQRILHALSLRSSTHLQKFLTRWKRAEDLTECLPPNCRLHSRPSYLPSSATAVLSGRVTTRGLMKPARSATNPAA